MSQETEIVRVELAERSYDIRIGDGNLPQAGPFLLEQGRATHAVVPGCRRRHSPHVVVTTCPRSSSSTFSISLVKASMITSFSQDTSRRASIILSSLKTLIFAPAWPADTRSMSL